MAGKNPDAMSRGQALRHFAELTRRAGRPVLARELPTGLFENLIRHLGSLEAARRAARLAAPSLSRRWSTEKVIDELRTLQRRGYRITTSELVAHDRHDLLNAIYGYIGNIRRARGMAGIPEPRRLKRDRMQWDADLVISEVAGLYETEQSVAAADVPVRLHAAGEYYFGGWRAAVEAAGLDYDKVRLVRAPYGKPELLDRVRLLSRKRPDMSLAQLDEEYGAIANALRASFGSIEAAARTAGVRNWPIRLHYAALSRREAVARLKARQRDGRAVHRKVIRKEDPKLLRSVLRHFRSWEDAIEQAGCTNDSPREKWDAERVLALLRARRKAGLSLRSAAVGSEDPALLAAAVRYFGSYRQAARRVRVELPTHERRSRDQIIEELRSRAARGEQVDHANLPRNLYQACQRCFGSIQAACKAAGVPGPPPPGPRRSWNKQKVLAALRARREAGQSLQSQAVKREDAGLHSAAVHNFGSYQNAVRRFGVKPWASSATSQVVPKP